MNEGLRPAITNLTPRSLIETRKTGASKNTYSPTVPNAKTPREIVGHWKTAPRHKESRTRAAELLALFNHKVRQISRFSIRSIMFRV
jgi:hypothetical protein